MIGRTVMIACCASLVACQAPPTGSAEPRGVDAPAPGAVLSDVECGACHATEELAWRGSAHARGAENRVLEGELAVTEHEAECLGCHAPDAASRDVHASVRCTSCHAAPHAGGSVGDDACARCHEFTFDAAAREHDVPWAEGLLQQSTHAERALAGRTRTCAGCHMPTTPGGTDHHLLGLDDDAFRASALACGVVVTSEADHTQVHVTLTANEVDHAVPTGDVFRRLVVTAENDRGRASATLRRYFAAVPRDGTLVRDEVDDDRIRPGETRVVRLSLPRSASAATVRVAIHRLDLELARRRGIPDEVVIEPLHEAVVVP